jgi:hypothetical protein
MVACVINFPDEKNLHDLKVDRKRRNRMQSRQTKWRNSNQPPKKKLSMSYCIHMISGNLRKK